MNRLAFKHAILLGSVAVLAVMTASIAVASTGGWVERYATGPQPSNRYGKLASISFGDTLHGWAVGDSGVLRTVDGGQTWAPVDSAGIPYTYEDDAGQTHEATRTMGSQSGGIEAVGADVVWIAADSDVFRSTNGGQTWQTFSPAGETIPKPAGGYDSVVFRDLHFLDAQRGWICGQDGLLVWTDDGGASWRRRIFETAGDKPTLHGVCFTDAMHGYLVGSLSPSGSDAPEGVIYRTTDGGTTWTTTRLPSAFYLLDVDFSSTNVGWIAGVPPSYGGAVWRTTDAGATWKPCSVATPGWIWALAAVSDTEAVVSGGGTAPVEFHRTRDGGRTWSYERLAGSSDEGVNRMSAGPAGVWAVSSSPTTGHRVLHFDPVASVVSPVKISITKSPTGSSYTVRRRAGVARWSYAATVKKASGGLVVGKKVILQYYYPKTKGWYSVATLKTNSKGKVSRTLTFKKAGSTYYRWYVPADGRYQPAYSSKTKVTVK